MNSQGTEESLERGLSICMPGENDIKTGSIELGSRFDRIGFEHRMKTWCWTKKDKRACMAQSHQRWTMLMSTWAHSCKTAWHRNAAYGRIVRATRDTNLPLTLLHFCLRWAMILRGEVSGLLSAFDKLYFHHHHERHQQQLPKIEWNLEEHTTYQRRANSSGAIRSSVQSLHLLIEKSFYRAAKYSIKTIFIDILKPH